MKMKIEIAIVFALGYFVACSQLKSNPKEGFLRTFITQMQNRVERLKRIVAENYSEINAQRANRTEKKLPQIDLRQTDLRLPYLLPFEVRAQKNTNIFPFELLYSVVRWVYSIDPASREQQAGIYQRLQEEIPNYVRFPCNVTGGRSETRPTSVDHVRPGDIDLVVAFGDSLIHGNGIKGSNVMADIISDDDVSAAIGGAKTWRQYLTLPNILKEFNPNLKGYVEKSSGFLAFLSQSHYNLAVPGAVMDDVITMAKRFVRKAKADPRVDFESDWKLITILTGAVDFCFDICYWSNPYDSIAHARKELRTVFDYLMDNSPRTIVNFIPSANTRRFIDQQTGLSNLCKEGRAGFCPCLYGKIFEDNADKHEAIIEQIIKAQSEVASDEKYRKKKDFAVLPQPILQDMTTFGKITSPSGRKRTDWRNLGPDCFHFSQRGTAIMANAVWNSLLTPFHQKKPKFCEKLLEEFLCPTEANPYIVTYGNTERT